MSHLPARLLSILLGVSLALAAGELLERARTGYGTDDARRELATIESATVESVPRAVEALERGADGPVGVGADARVLHPYLGYGPEQAPALLTAELARFAALPEGTCSIVVLGGSVAANFHNEGLPALVGLPPLAGRPVAVFNGASGGYKQPQQVMQLAYMLSLGVAPTLVLNLDGFNEVALGRANADRGFHPTQPSTMHWLPVARTGLGGTSGLRDAAELWSLRAELLTRLEATRDDPWLASALIGGRRLAAVRRAQGRYRQRALELADRLGRADDLTHLTGPSLDTDPDGTAAVESWAACSRSLAALCAERGIAYVHVLQPTLHDPGAKPVTDEERRSGDAPDAWLAGVLDGYPRLRARGADLAAGGIAFLDASRVFASVDETLYYDSCHFGARGNRLLAAAVAEFLEAEREAGRLDL